MLQLFSSPKFQRDYRTLPEEIKTQAEQTVQKLRENPFDPTLNIKKLKDFKPAVWRVRIGAYRLLYSFTKTSLYLLRIQDRKDIYRSL